MAAYMTHTTARPNVLQNENNESHGDEGINGLTFGTQIEGNRVPWIETIRCSEII